MQHAVGAPLPPPHGPGHGRPDGHTALSTRGRAGPASRRRRHPHRRAGRIRGPAARRASAAAGRRRGRPHPRPPRRPRPRAAARTRSRRHRRRPSRPRMPAAPTTGHIPLPPGGPVPLPAPPPADSGTGAATLAVLLIGPAGAGKTTVARHWADRRRVPTAHISLDDVREWVCSGFADPQSGWNDHSEAQYRLARRTCGFAARNFLANGISCILDDAVFPDRPSSASAAGSAMSAPACCPSSCCPAWRSSWSATPSAAATAGSPTRKSPASTAGWPAGTAPGCRSSTTPSTTWRPRPGSSTTSSPGPSPARRPGDGRGPARCGRPRSDALTGPGRRAALVGSEHVRGVRGPPRPAARPVRGGRQRRRPWSPAPPTSATSPAARRPAPYCCSAPAEDVLLCPRTPTGDPADGRPDEQLRLTVLPTSGRRSGGRRRRPGRARPGAESLAVEEHHLTVARHRAMGSVAPRLRLADLGRAVEQQRIVKDEEEIACLRIAAEIADQALGELLESILVGRTERHLALELERRLVDHGADGPAFPTSVATGPQLRAAAGTGPPTAGSRRAISSPSASAPNYRGYRCEIGRTFVIGTTPGGLADRAVRPGLRRSAGRPRGPRTGRRVPRRGPCGPPGPGRRGPRRGPRTARPGTVSGSKSTRTRSWHLRPWVNWTLVCRSPSNRGSTSRAGAVSGSMTRSSCAPRRTADPSYSPSRPRSCSRSSSAAARFLGRPPASVQEIPQPWLPRTTSRTAWCSSSTEASSGPSSSSSTSSPARARPSCAPSSRTCSPARSSTRRSTPA